MSVKPPKISRDDIPLIRNKIRVMSPIVKRWVRGKGFSAKELGAVGLNIKQARRIGIPVDKRRKSLHEHNVDLLKSLLEKYGLTSVGASPKTHIEVAKATLKAVSEVVATETKVGEKLSVEEVAANIADDLVNFIDSARRRGVAKLLGVFKEAIRKHAPTLLDRWEEAKVRSILELILKDLSSAGFGSLSTKFFTKKDDWDASMAREIISERLRRVIEEESG